MTTKPDNVDELDARISAYFDSEQDCIEAALNTLYGVFPQWIPTPSIDRAKRIIQYLFRLKLVSSNISRLVSEAESDELSFPGNVTDAPTFAQYIYELAHLRYAISLDKIEGLRCLAGEQASHGQRFKDGRKPNTGSLIRKAIAKLLKANSAIRNPEIWESMKHKPPRGWTACDNHLGKYFEGPENKNMNYERFCNVCSDERKKIKQ